MVSRDARAEAFYSDLTEMVLRNLTAGMDLRDVLAGLCSVTGYVVAQVPDPDGSKLEASCCTTIVAAVAFNRRRQQSEAGSPAPLSPANGN
ncbi:hypothetical protein [Oceanibaculum indicum]|uniref:Uncharacterized protein n=1 Tax=Oceanibaculum indicum P24 TaxID=1207063 RepID=K2J727_9PROT|nr:hypothetical protein [Oceanibaculum indicum]EKE70878.1 hypothetical protein P24_15084 [Oceanibaculum indicum P24]